MSKALKYYLAAYNFIAFSFWALYLLYFISTGLQTNMYSVVVLNIAQGLALFEILHALLKWVKSPVGSTIAQVASRLLVVVLIDICILVTIEHRDASQVSATDVGIIIVSFAWGVTELIRYSLYFLGQFGIQPKWLLWMRYSLFIGLYPLGVTGEWVIIIAALWVGAFSTAIYSFFAGILFFAYLYYFPVLYKYMWKQRKAKLGGHLPGT